MTLPSRHCATFLLLCLAVTACGEDGSAPGMQAGSNRARLEFEVDLQGVKGFMVMEAEVISEAGIVWGPGATPDITGVIGTGNYTIHTAGTLQSPNGRYVFTGQDNFADFTDLMTAQSFRVQWFQTATGLTMVVNPFGPGPVRYECMLTRASYL